MKIKVAELKRVLGTFESMYKPDEDSLVDVDVQPDDPGEGKICSILTMQMSSEEHETSITMEIYGHEENRLPSMTYNGKIKPPVK